MLDEKDIAGLMRTESELAEPASSRLDVDRAMRTGRRQRWYGRTAGATLLVAALVAGAVTVPNLIRPTEQPVAAGFTVPMSVPRLPVLPKAQDTIDPELSYLGFGWVPDAYSKRQYQAGLLTGGPAAYLSASPPGSPNPDGWRGVAVTLYPHGVAPAAPQRDSEERGRQVSVTPASADGQDAVWTTYSGAKLREAFLRWHYAPESWVEVRVADRAGDVAGTALRVAEHLRLSGTDRANLPFKAIKLPPTLRPVLLNIEGDPSAERAWSASITFTAASPRADQGQQLGRTLDVSVWPYDHQDTKGADSQGKEYPKPNAVVDGHPARRWPPSGPVTDLTVYDVNGVNVDIHADHPDVLGQLGPEGALTTYRGLDLVEHVGGWKTGLN